MAKNFGSEIDIPTLVKVEKDALENVGKYMKECDFDNVVVLYGTGLIDLFGQKVMPSFEKAGVNVLSYHEEDSVDIDDLMRMAFEMPSSVNAIVGIGGGKVIDAGKYMGFLKKLPFISVPTSIATDGFCSATASLIVDGKRASVPAKMPFGIIVDTQVVKTSPRQYILSGIGDMMSKITAIYDWKYEEACGYGKVNDFSVMIARKALNSFVRTPMTNILDDVFIKELVDSLTMSGIANEIAGSSAPTSGSEHLISHALDKICERPMQHGLQVGIATYIVAKVQNHRYKRVDEVFEVTGFWEYVKSLNPDREMFEKAIEMAPSIKQNRHVYLHEEDYRKAAIDVLNNDERMKEIFG